jgi:8-oxo-dGTP pyrophosphatase MutT (NUDIX family)
MEKRTTTHQVSTGSMFCNNCGAKGHLFRTCRDPVLSFGIILIDSNRLPVNTNEVKVLMIRRKDSMSFAEFMRGKYDPENTEYVSRLFANMTLGEQTAIVCESFDTLWRRLWGDDRSCSDYATSKQKFETLNRTSLMINNISPYSEPEWGFPKGRRIRGESDMDCAIREFTEETNVPRDAYQVFRNILLEETFTGLNNIRYRHVYYVAVLTHPEKIRLHQPFTSMQRREISGIAWKTITECLGHVRPHHVERKGMIEQLRSVLETFESV